LAGVFAIDDQPVETRSPHQFSAIGIRPKPQPQPKNVSLVLKPVKRVEGGWAWHDPVLFSAYPRVKALRSVQRGAAPVARGGASPRS